MNEAANIRRFDALYGPCGTSRHALPPPGFVRVPELFPEFPATRRVLVMEWLDGQRVMSLCSPSQKLRTGQMKVSASGDGDDWSEAEEAAHEAARRAASLPLIDLGIRCTLSQLIETGVMHADPHGGNLLRLHGSGDLAYLDFGLVSEVPPSVRDALVAAATLLVFSRDYEAVAGLFGDLALVPPEVIENEYEFEALTAALAAAAEATLIFPSDVRAATASASVGVANRGGGAAAGATAGGNRNAGAAEAAGTAHDALLRERGRGRSAIPDVRFDQLLGALLALVPRFRFVLPPYFLNNARALGTLEGMARYSDPDFNILAVVYPFAVKRLLANPSGSPVLRRVLRQLLSDEKTGALSLVRLRDMVDDAAALTGVPRETIIRDALKTSNGLGLAAAVVLAGVRECIRVCVSLLAAVTGLRWLRRRWHRAMVALRDGTYKTATR